MLRPSANSGHSGSEIRWHDRQCKARVTGFGTVRSVSANSGMTSIQHIAIEGDHMLTKQVFRLTLPIAAVCAFLPIHNGIHNHPRNAS